MINVDPVTQSFTFRASSDTLYTFNHETRDITWTRESGEKDNTGDYELAAISRYVKEGSWTVVEVLGEPVITEAEITTLVTLLAKLVATTKDADLPIGNVNHGRTYVIAALDDLREHQSIDNSWDDYANKF